MSYSKCLWAQVKLKKLGLLAILSYLFCGFSFFSIAQDTSQSDSQMKVFFNKAQSFASIYESELGKPQACNEAFKNGVKFCFNALKNDGNAPFILLPNISQNHMQPKGVVVLFHGLSDSPYFMSSIGEFLRTKGYIVIAPLTPGHGKIDADADMQDETLKTRWYRHTDNVMNFAKQIADTANLPLVVGGFSTGGAFATYFTINHPDQVDALLLFSGALELAGGAEAMSNIWGMKSLASWLDGEYETQGAHPYKYPSVASYSGLVLMDVIHDIRDILETKKVSKAIFAAHSMSDNTTLFSGIEKLTSQIEGNHSLFKIDESFDLCHADLPMSAVQIINLRFDKSKINASELCSVPKANPLHQQMLLMLDIFLNDNLSK
jgi:esterase/lipase